MYLKEVWSIGSDEYSELNFMRVPSYTSRSSANCRRQNARNSYAEFEVS